MVWCLKKHWKTIDINGRAASIPTMAMVTVKTIYFWKCNLEIKQQHFKIWYYFTPLFRRTTERNFECVLVIDYFSRYTIKGRRLGDFSSFYLKNYCLPLGSITINGDGIQFSNTIHVPLSWKRNHCHPIAMKNWPSVQTLWNSKQVKKLTQVNKAHATHITSPNSRNLTHLTQPMIKPTQLIRLAFPSPWMSLFLAGHWGCMYFLFKQVKRHCLLPVQRSFQI